MWIEYHQELRDHLKVSRLADALAVPYPHALGIVSCLWLWAASNAPDGKLDHLSDPEIAHACRCDGILDGGTLRHALVASGFVDPNRIIHKWNDYGIKHLLAARERKARWKEAHGTEPERSKNVTGTATVPTVPTVPNKKIKDGADKNLRAFMQHLTQTLKTKTGQDADPLLIRKAYGKVVGYLKQWPEDQHELNTVLDQSPRGRAQSWYVSLLCGQMEQKHHERLKELTAQIGKRCPD